MTKRRAFLAAVALAGRLALSQEPVPPEAAAQAEPALAEAPPPPAFAPTERYVDRVRREGAVLELTLKDTIERTLRNNLDIAIEYDNSQLARQGLRGALGAYDPFFSLGGVRSSVETPNSLQGASETVHSLNFGPSISQQLPGGGSLGVGLTNSRTRTDALAIVNPLFGSQLDLSLTQPLLRGFLETGIQRQIREARLRIGASDAQFRQRVADVVQLAQDRYWFLLGAIETYEAQRQSRDLAVTQYERTRQRAASGLLSGVAITSSRAEVAGREQQMFESEVQILQAQNALKQSLSADPGDEIWRRVVLPVDRPEVREPTLQLEAAVALALTQRPELEQLKKQVEIAQVNVAFYRRETLPGLSFQGGLGAVGRSGELAPGQGGDLANAPGVGGLGNALGQVFRFDYPSWSAGLTASIPIGNRTANAQLEAARITERQVRSQLSKGQQAVVVEVRNAWEGVMTRKKSLDAARLARELSEEQLASETARFQVGFTTNFEVLRYQRDLVEAQVRELTAVINYQSALTALQKSIGAIVGPAELETARRE